MGAHTFTVNIIHSELDVKGFEKNHMEFVYVIDILKINRGNARKRTRLD